MKNTKFPIQNRKNNFIDICKDAFFLTAEYTARQIYWRIPSLSTNVAAKQHATSPQHVNRAELRAYLSQIGIIAGARVMVHSSVQNLALFDEITGNIVNNPIAIAIAILQDLQNLIGPTGTLVMPTHAWYKDDPGYHFNSKDGVVYDYDPLKTPSNVGLMNELFRRLPGAKRSLHPLNTISCLGPDADSLLKDNLNSDKPLPHGVASGYYRLSLTKGIVISIGVPLFKYITVMHVAEDIREQEWPVKSFYRERIFRIPVCGQVSEWVVRERHPEFARCFCINKFRRDLLREGILHESYIGEVRVDWAHISDVVAYTLQRNANTAYPYYLTSLAGPFA